MEKQAVMAKVSVLAGTIPKTSIHITDPIRAELFEKGFIQCAPYPLFTMLLTYIDGCLNRPIIGSSIIKTVGIGISQNLPINILSDKIRITF